MVIDKYTPRKKTSYTIFVFFDGGREITKVKSENQDKGKQSVLELYGHMCYKNVVGYTPKEFREYCKGKDLSELQDEFVISSRTRLKIMLDPSFYRY